MARGRPSFWQSGLRSDRDVRVTVVKHPWLSGEAADEDGLMTVKELERAIKNCRGDAACISSVEALFVSGGGTIAQAPGGKVFTDRFGGKVFIPSA